MNHQTRNMLLAMARPMRLETLIRWSGHNSFFPFYHTVHPRHLPHIRHLYRVKTPRDFERDLDHLLHYFEPLGLDDYLKQPKRIKGRRTMVLTFDDGLKECHSYIAPLLRKKGVPATFFLNNQFIDNRGLFYRYKASLLVDRIYKESLSMKKAAAFLKIAENQLLKSILTTGYDQRAVLDALAGELELDFSAYLQSSPVYMSTGEVKDLLAWGFEIGGHSHDHRDFTSLEPEEMVQQVISGLEDLKQRFAISRGYFSFPFTSDGVPEKVIDALLAEAPVCALLGSAGLKHTGKPAFIQRVPMEQFETTATDAMKAEYLYYALKKIPGRNRLRY